ncbi:hypothetical protein SAMN05216262_101456 [Colwellia chukchiensis]|uniref:Orphan protein n=1 Tax=Colwellia chukchiensis TaxID=641665 RepID=A0A1H7HG79_9GAMM|nr:DUF6170 family protein [Colwellia chukchiensis]SEK47920.1 hypothetical protein SAMN05216262_101456 [Colwellia chukchiensis]
MTIYFSSNKIPALQDFSLHQRQAILALAQAKLTAPEKLVLNIIKLLMLIPPFLFIANLQGMAMLVSVAVVLLAYFFLLRPIMLFFSLKYLDKAIAQYQKSEP